MKICLIGNGLTNLVLAKNLVNKKIKVDLYSGLERFNKMTSRTIGITKNNFDFFNNKILDIKKFSWPINQIKVFSEFDINNEIINFNKKNNLLFSIVKYKDIFNLVNNSLKKNKYFKKIKIKQSSYKSILNKKDYNLIINSESKNPIFNNFFYNKIYKNYNSTAYTCILKHKKCINNNATQIFSKIGPIAFLPCSKTETSIVFSILENENIKSEQNIKDLITNYNNKYNIKSFSKFEKFVLKFSVQNNYFHNNILSFGQNLHQIHPLAGQGFNMILRDVQMLSELIDSRLELGLTLDKSLLKDFQSKTKHLNFIFSLGIDFIHEFFKFENNYGNNYSRELFKFVGHNKTFTKYVKKFADEGFRF